MQGKRLAVLDGLRGVAAIAVAAFHISTLFKHVLLPAAGLAVDFFFLLSGYVIGLAYEQKLATAKVSLLQFIYIRLVRLLPMVTAGALTGAAFYLLADHTLSPGTVALNTGLALLCVPTLGLAFGYTHYPLNPPGWSLTDELGTNVLWAPLVQQLRVKALLAVVLVSALCLAVLAMRIGSVSEGGSSIAGYANGWGLFIRDFIRAVLSFSIGMTLWQVRDRQLPYRLDARCPPALLTLLLLGSFYVGARAGWVGELGCVLLLYPALVRSGAAERAAVRGAPIMERLGELSYPLYAIHFPTMLWLSLLTGHIHANRTFSIPAILLVNIMVAFVWHRMFDQPIQNWFRHRIPKWCSRQNRFCR